jgi:hypothetical protein
LLISSFLEIDFNKTPLSGSARRQLAEIVRTISRPDGAGRAGLRNLILRNVFDLNWGTYVPLAQDFYLKAKLPDVSRTLVGSSSSPDLEPFPAPLFTNALLIPSGYGGTGFHPDQAPRPLDRATNTITERVSSTCEKSCELPKTRTAANRKRGNLFRFSEAYAGALGGIRTPTPRFVGRSFTLITLHFLANGPFIAPLNLNGLRGFCKPERWHRRLG